MKITVGKKFITIVPKPTKDIPNGLKATFNRDGKYVTAYATCDIIKGKSRYLMPKVDDEGRFIISASLSK